MISNQNILGIFKKKQKKVFPNGVLNTSSESVNIPFCDAGGIFKSHFLPLNLACGH